MASPRYPSRSRRRSPASWAWVILVLATLTVLSVNASSPPPKPLKRIHHPSSLSLSILPRSTHLPLHKRLLHPWTHTLLSSDTLRLSVTLPSLGSDEVFLHLTPNEDMFSPDAQVVYTAADGGERREPLRKEEWRVYHGVVVVGQEDSDTRWREEEAGVVEAQRTGGLVRGNARVMVHQDGLGRDGEGLEFEGSFEVDRQTYHVLTKENYRRHRLALDPEVEDIVVGNENGLVIFLEGDHLDQPDLPTSEASSCSHDTLPFNQNTSHPVHSLAGSPIILDSEPYRHFSPKWSPLDPFAAFSPDVRDFEVGSGKTWIRKRDDISTGGGSGPSGNFVGSIGSTTGCPTETRVVYMGVAADCNYVASYGSSERAKTQIINNWNQASSLYKATFNIALGITELNVMDQTCPSSAPASAPWNVGCSSSVSLNSRLSLFSAWRGTTNRASTAGLWHLMTACPTNTEVGVAWLGTLCQTTSQSQGSNTVSGTGVSTATRVEWSLVAHEVGHNFGAVHDCTSGCVLPGSVSGSACCPLSASTCNANSQFIMNPTTNTQEVAFSPCTVGNVCSSLGSRSVSSSCLQSPGGRTTITLQECGNGIVEDGEDCDPGLNVTSPCCNSATCKFNTGAVCDPSSSLCCTGACAFASNTTVCRPSANTQCDFAETCTGSSALCPADRTASDGTGCGNGLSCASGICTSLDQQCATVGASMGLTTACSMRDDRSCMVSCQNPANAGSCLVLQSQLVDGSPCGYGGHCYNSTCQAGSLNDTVAAWYTQNLQYSIPATIGVSLLALAIIFFFVRCLCCRGRGRGQAKGSRHRAVLPPAVPTMVGISGGSGAAAATRSPPRTLQRNSRQAYNAPSPYPSPQAPYQPSPPPQRISTGSGFGSLPPFPPGQAPMAQQPPGTYNPYAQPHYQQPQGGDGWVDARTYNGPNWRP